MEKTRLQNLVQHKSGGYYARLFLNGKEVWKSLKTKHFSVAEARLAEAQKEHRQRRGTKASASSAKMTFQQASELHLAQLDGKPNIKRRTKDYWHEIHEALPRSWPELADMQIRRITKTECREWAAKFSKTGSETRYNNSISFLRHVINVAVECGIVFTNVAECLERKAVKPKQLELPSLAQFAAFVAEMRVPKGRYSLAAGVVM